MRFLLILVISCAEKGGTHTLEQSSVAVCEDSKRDILREKVAGSCSFCDDRQTGSGGLLELSLLPPALLAVGLAVGLTVVAAVSGGIVGGFGAVVLFRL